MSRPFPLQASRVRANARGRPRGAALVETSLLMIVLIPLLLYSLFLIDAAYMKLDLQETVVSGLWDFSTLNSEKGHKQDRRAYGEDEALDPPPSNWEETPDWRKVMSAVRSSYSDHTSAFDDGGEVGVVGYGDRARITGNHNHWKHHKIYFAAQYTFQFNEEKAGGADTQFRCSMEDDSAWATDTVILGSFARSQHNLGGKIRCDAKGHIYNYLIPEKLFTQFTDVKMSNLTKRKATEDSHAFQGTGHNIRAQERGALLFHTWPLENGASREPGSRERIGDADIGASSLFAGPSHVDGPFYDRVVEVASSAASATYTPVRAAAAKFASTAREQGLMRVQTGGPTQRDLGGLPNIAGVYLIARYKPEDPGQTRSSQWGLMSSSFQSTPYNDINPNYSNAYSARGAYYLGCNQEERSACH